MENEIAGGLIKKVCAYMFDKEFQTEDKNDETDAYFEVMKLTLDKSKIKAANASEVYPKLSPPKVKLVGLEGTLKISKLTVF